MKKIVSNIVLLIFFAWLIYFVYHNRENFYKITHISFIFLIPAYILSLCFFVGNGNFLRLLLNRFSIFISIKESTTLALLTAFFNTIMPLQSGAILRAYYLKKKHNFNYTSFSVTLYATYVIVLFNVAVIGIVMSMLIYVQYHIISYLVVGILTLIFFMLGTTFVTTLDIPPQEKRLFQFLKKIVDNWNQVKEDKKLVLRLQFQQLINFAIRTTIMYLVFLSMGLAIPIEKVIYFQIIASIMFVINITPGAIGIQEILFVLIGKLLFIETADILIMALLLRSVSWSVIFTCAPFASYILLKKNVFTVRTEMIKNANPTQLHHNSG